MSLSMHDATTITFADDTECAWVRAEVSPQDRTCRVHSSGYTDLKPDDCRILAAWLNRQANRIEGRPAFFGRQVAVIEPEGVA